MGKKGVVRSSVVGTVNVEVVDTNEELRLKGNVKPFIVHVNRIKTVNFNPHAYHAKEESQITQEELQPVAPTQSKRGRPRKCENLTKVVQKQLPGKRRGRPPKVKAQIERTKTMTQFNPPRSQTESTIAQKRRPGRPPKARPVEVPTFFVPTQRTEHFIPKPPNETFPNSTQFNTHHADVPPKYNFRTTIKRTQRY